MQPKTFCQKAWKILLTVQKTFESYEFSKKRLFFKTLFWTRRTQLWQHCLSSWTKKKEKYLYKVQKYLWNYMFSNISKKDEKNFILVFWKRRIQFWQLCLGTFNQKSEIFRLTSKIEFKISFFLKKVFYSKFSSGHIDFSCDNTAKSFRFKVQKLHNIFFSIEKFFLHFFPWALRNQFWQPRRNFFS